MGFIIVSSFLTKLFSFGKAQGIVIFPFIFVANRHLAQNPTFLNHERIHLAQVLEMLVLPFYLIYLTEFLIRFIQYHNFDLAYRNISFEKEAYARESDPHYLKNRKFWAFMRYMK